MDIGPPVLYRIDADDRLTEVNDAWRDFARDNDGGGLDASKVLGRPLWDFLVDATTLSIYRGIVKRLRDGGTPMRFRFRCDASTRRRLLAMDITGEAAGVVRFLVTPVEDEVRPPLRFLESTHAHDGRLIRMCGWCNRVVVPSGLWVEAEEAIDPLGLFANATMPAVTHGMCPPCYEAIFKATEDPAVAAAGMTTVGAIQVA